MNSVRSAILSGEGLRPPSPVARKKKPQPEGEAGSLLAKVSIKREQSRHIDHRREDRHTAPVERAVLILRGQEIDVALINVSPGGAMIEGEAPDAVIGEAASLRFGDCEPTGCDIRWIRAPRIGLEFREETAIVAPRSVRSRIVRTLRGEAPAEADDAGRVRSAPSPRQRLQLTGAIHFDQETTSARIRNISVEGAMVECPWDFHLGTELLLDLGQAGTLLAKVRWCRGGQIGLKFASRFDLKKLAERPPAPEPKPEAAPRPSGGYAIPGAPADTQGKRDSDKRLSVSAVADLYGKARIMR